MNAEIETYVSQKIGRAWTMSKGQRQHAKYRPALITFAQMRAALEKQFDAWLDVLAKQLAGGEVRLVRRIRPMLAYADVTQALNFTHLITTADQDGADAGLMNSLPARRVFEIGRALGHPVDAMYVHILGRAADDAGRAWWVNQLETRRTPLSAMCAAMEAEKAVGAS